MNYNVMIGGLHTNNQISQINTEPLRHEQATNYKRSYLEDQMDKLFAGSNAIVDFDGPIGTITQDGHLHVWCAIVPTN